jgi:hypothetical protein
MAIDTLAAWPTLSYKGPSWGCPILLPVFCEGWDRVDVQDPYGLIYNLTS